MDPKTVASDIRKVLCRHPIPIPATINDVPNEIWHILERMDPTVREHYFGDGAPSTEELHNGEVLSDLLLSWPHGLRLNESIIEDIEEADHFAGDYISSISATASQLLKMERNARQAFRNNKEKFPMSIWNCCKRRCFASIAIDLGQVALFEELKTIHSAAEEIHEELRQSSTGLQTRQKGVGGSKIAIFAPTRAERERSEGIFSGTDRQRILKKFATFILEVLPFLYGKADAPNGTKCPAQKLCTCAIFDLLGISRNFLYLRNKGPSANEVTDEEISCIVDCAGIRLRQNRRAGDRTGYPCISDLPQYDCGCFQPCLGNSQISWLKNEYKAFSACARMLNPRRKENRYLLNAMYSPFSHRSVSLCNKALAALYTVSKGHINDVRLALQQMCDDPSADHNAFLAGGIQEYRKHHRHPMNRYPEHIRERVEKHLDMILRADPAGASERNVCRVYSPEINTKEKLRRVLAKVLDDDDSIDDQLSYSTLQRITDKYLKDRKCTIVFTQNDHNACPNCKTMNYAVLEYYHESKELEREYERKFREIPPDADPKVKKEAQELKERLEAEQQQEDLTLKDFKAHLSRDAAIRKTIKAWSDHFRKLEREYLEVWTKGEDDGLGTWNGLPHHAIITHQDDMTKVDLPHFLVTVSSDISRWRFDVNAHASAVNDDCVVFSHEQGTGAKNASFISEMILLDHLVRCKGEAIKVVVSDNAAVGKNWITTIALPQYIVDQGLADIVFIVYLENNHGKWLADMLFGQLQSRKRRSTLLSIDDLLSEFEKINRKSGKIKGLAVNPLASVDFATIFDTLGYETSPPKDFGFVKRNIHFAAACTQEARKKLHPILKNLLGPGLPKDEGMVRISSSPPNPKPRNQLPYEERYFDVPAARVTGKSASVVRNHQQNSFNGNTAAEPEPGATPKPLEIPMDKGFSVGGNGVVSQNTAKRVGYNGSAFRKQSGTQS